MRAPHVLIIEPDLRFAAALQRELERVGATVQRATDGPTGFDLAKATRPDLILLTIELPGLNGFLICKKFKKDDDLKPVPLIVLSSECTEETFANHRKLRTHADDYVFKPIAARDLVERASQFVHLVEREDAELDVGEEPVLVDDTSSMTDSEAPSPADDRASNDDGERQASDQPTTTRASDLLRLREQVNLKDKELQDLRNKVLENEHSVRAREAQILTLQKRTAELESESGTWRSMERGLRERIGALHDELETTRNRIGSVDLVELDELQARLAGTEARLEAMQQDVTMLAERMGTLHLAARTIAETADLLLPLVKGAQLRADQDERVRALVAQSADLSSRSLELLDARATQRALEDEGIFVSQRAIDECVLALQQGRALLLAGPPGTGKTTLARSLPTLFASGGSAPTLSLAVALEDWEPFHFVGGVVAHSAHNHGVFTEAVLQAIETPLWLFVDELSRADPNLVLAPLMEVLNGSMAGKRLALPFAGEDGRRQELVIPNDFRLICAMNEADGQYLHPMAPELERRFRIVQLEPPDQDSELRLVRGHVRRKFGDDHWELAESVALDATDVMAQIRRMAHELDEPRLNLGSAYVIEAVEHAIGLLQRHGDRDRAVDEGLANEIVNRLVPARSRTLARLADIFPSEPWHRCRQHLQRKIAKRSLVQDWKA